MQRMGMRGAAQSILTSPKRRRYATVRMDWAARGLKPGHGTKSSSHSNLTPHTTAYSCYSYMYRLTIA